MNPKVRVDVTETSKMSKIHPETVKRLIREGKASRYQIPRGIDGR